MQSPEDVGRRPTQEQRRTATRAKVAAAAAETMLVDGYAALTIRAVAGRAEVSQGTVMHYFATRQLLLEEAATELGVRLLGEVAGLAGDAAIAEDDVPAMLDELWKHFRAPLGVAIGQLWCAAWSDSDLVEVVAGFERRSTATTVAAMRRVHPPSVDTARLEGFVELVLATLKGLLILTPITGVDDVDERWKGVRPYLVLAARDVVDPGVGVLDPSDARRNQP
jgi:AcrR family transcriptional regulator